MSEQIFQKDLVLQGSHTLLVDDFLSLEDFRIFILYDLGYWDLFDLRNQKLINKGRINYQEGEELQLHVYNKKKIAYYTIIEEKLRILNIEEGKLDPNWNHNLPTKLAAEGISKSDNAYDELKETLQLVVMKKTGLIVSYEQKTKNQQKFVILTVFNQEQQSYFNQLKKQMNKKHVFNIQNFNDEDTIILYNEEWKNQKVSFFTWNFGTKDNTFFEHKVNIPYSGTLCQCSKWLDNQVLLFFVNNDNNQEDLNIPEVLCYDLEKEDTGKLQLIGEQDCLFDKALYVDPYCQSVMMALFGSKNNMDLVIYKPLQNVIINRCQFSGFPNMRQNWMSPDGHYFAQVDFLDNNQYKGEDKVNVSMNLKCEFYYKTEIKYWYLLFLEQSGYTQKYNQHVLQEIIEMLTLKEN